MKKTVRSLLWPMLALGTIPLLAGCLGSVEMPAVAATTPNPDTEVPMVRVYEEIRNVKVLPEGCVDTTSLEGIVDGVLRDAGKSDEERVLALYQWYRRMIFHHRLMGGDRRDVLKVINSYGCNLCGSQAAVFVILLQKAGYRTRVMAGSAPGDLGGHTFVEVQYGDKWHCLDTMSAFAVYTRDEPPHLASLEELKADPTLVTLAVEEKRGVPGFLYCMDNQEMTGADKDKLRATMGKADLTWSTLLFKSGTLLDFWSQAPANAKTIDGGTYGGRYTPGVLDFTLKSGENFVREWDNVANMWLKRASHPDFGPHHTCGAADEHDPANFKYFEPYLKENFGHTRKCYRWFGNGYLEWQPTAIEGETEKAFQVTNLDRGGDGTFTIAEAGKPGSLIIPVKCPHAGVGIELELKLSQKGAGSTTRVFLVELGKSREVWKKEGDADGVEKVVIDHQDSPAFEYQLRIEARAGAEGAVAFAPVRLRTIFQENIYALPGLAPGKNTVNVSAAEPVKLAGNRLVVTYEWAEGEGWQTEKSVSRAFTELPARFEVEVAGPKMPRMRRLIVRLEAAGKR